MKKIVPILIWTIIIIGFLFRIFHLPFGDIMFISGSGLLLLFSISYLSTHFTENKIRSLFQLSISLWMIRFVFSFLFWPHGFILLAICLLSTIVLIIFVFNEKYKFQGKDWFKISFMVCLFWITSLPQHQIFYFVKFNHITNGGRKQTNYIAWDRYSWFLNSSNRKKEALEANAMALKSLEKFAFENGYAFPYSIEEVLNEHREKIMKNSWTTFQPVNYDSLILINVKAGQRQLTSISIPLTLTDEAKPFIGWWELDSTLQNGLNVQMKDPKRRKDKWKFARNSFLSISEYNKGQTLKSTYPFGRFDVKNKLFRHHLVDKEKIETYNFQFKDSLLILSSNDSNGKTYYFFRSEEDWDEEVKGPKPKRK